MDRAAEHLGSAARHAINLLRISGGSHVISTVRALEIVRASVPTVDLSDEQLIEEVARVAIADGAAVEFDDPLPKRR